MNNSNTAFSDRYFGKPDKSPAKSKSDYLAIMPRYRQRHLVKFIEAIPQGGTLLDLGCGKGKTVRLVQAFRPDVTIIATDITNMEPFLPEGVTFVLASADDLVEKVPLASCDAIVSEHVIEHIVYPNQYFESCYQLLKPGGRVFIETPNWTRLFLPFSPLYFWNDYTHIHPYSITAFRRAFMEYGFKEVYVQSISSIDFGRRFMKLRIEGGEVKTGQKPEFVVYKPHESKLRKLFNAILDLTIHPIARDILIGVAERPKQ